MPARLANAILRSSTIGYRRLRVVPVAVVLFALLWVGGVAAPLVGQDDLSKPILGPGLTEAALAARLTVVHEVKDEGLRKALENAYGEAASALRSQSSSRRTLADLAQVRREVEALQTQAGRPRPPEPDRSHLARLSAAALTTELGSAAALADEHGRTLNALEERLMKLPARQQELPSLIARAEQRVKTTAATLAGLGSAELDPLVLAARRTAASARATAAGLERDALKSELEAFSLVSERLSLRRAAARADHQDALRTVAAVRAAQQERLGDEARRAIDDAHEQRDQLDARHGEVAARRANENVRYAVRRADLRQRLPELLAELRRARTAREDLQKRFANAKSTIQIAGLTATSGELLRRQRARLSQQAAFHARVRNRIAETADIRLAQIPLADEISVDDDRIVDEIVTDESADIPDVADRKRIAVRIAADRRRLIENLMREYDARLTELTRLEAEDLQRADVAADFEAYIEQKILWVRSSQPLWSSDWSKLSSFFSVFGAATLHLPAVWSRALLSNYLVTGLGGLVLLALLGMRRRAGRRLEIHANKAAKPTTTVFAPTVWTFLLTVLLALPVPVVLLVLGAAAGTQGMVAQFGTGLTEACTVAAFAVLLIGVLRRITGPNGLAVVHFRWPESVTTELRKTGNWLLFSGVPLLFLMRLCSQGPEGSVVSLFSRLVFVLWWLQLAWLLGRLLRPERGILAGPPPVLGIALRTVVAVLAVGACLSLVVLSVVGYDFSATQLSRRLFGTIVVLFSLAVLRGLVNRWQVVQRRHLAIQQRKAELAAVRAAQQDNKEATGAKDSPRPVPDLDVVTVDEQASRLVRTSFLFVGVISLFGIWAQVLPALGVFREVELWSVSSTVSEEVKGGDGVLRLESRDVLVPITLASLLMAVVITLMTVIGAKNLPGLLRLSVLQRVRPGNQYAIATITQYLIVLVGAIAAFGAIGVGWARVQWLIAAVSLGLGFGLQEIFANFVSGLIILFEQPIRVGDFVTVDGTEGEVTRIRIRATTIRNLRRQELIVPNKQFITGQVINWTLSDTINRLTIDVGIAYGSDVDLARRILLEVAGTTKNVVAEPKPKALFKRFGDSALEFELRIFIRNLDHYPRVIDGVHSAIDAAFRKAGIVIAFPQRDVHVHSVTPGTPMQAPASPAQDGTGASS